MNRKFLPIKDYPLYNDTVDRLMLQSAVLNSGSDTRPSVHTIFWDETTVRGYLMEIEGDKDGQYFQSGEYYTAKKVKVLVELKKIEDAFVRYKKRRLGEGYEEPTEMPNEMLNEYYTWQARLTVLEAESEFLHKKLKEYTDKKQSEDDNRVLAFGLQGHGKFHGIRASNPDLENVLREMDGQKIAFSAEGVLIISDSRSPYNGMAVFDYRKLCDEWRKDLTKKKILRSFRPAWPTGAKNYLEEDSK
jgi:hypothetical protein